MKVTTNEALIRRRRRQALASSMLGLMVLGVGLVLSLTRAHLVAYAYGALIIGSMLSWIGIWLSDAWLRPPRPEQALGEALKAAGPAFALYNWVLPADHVLLAPWGLVLMSAHNSEGPVTIEGSRWREQRPLTQRLLSLGRRPLRSPGRWLDAEARSLTDAIRREEPDLADVPVSLLAVFTQPRVSLSLSEPDIPAVRADGLRAWVREQRRPGLGPARRRQLEMVLDRLAAARLGTASSG